MNVGVVGVGMAPSVVAMRVRMWLRHRSCVIMQMMLVVDVAVLVLQGLMFVRVRVSLRQMQPQTDAHQTSGEQQLRRHRFVT